MTELAVQPGSDRRIKARRLALIPTKLLVDSPRNANVLTDEEEEALAAEIRESGILATVLVVERKGKYVLVDGNHRAGVYRKLKVSKVPAMVVDMDDHMAALKGLSMNKLRGNQDLRVVSEIVRELAESGYKMKDLKAARFPEAELKMLLKSGEASLEELENDLLDGEASADDDEDQQEGLHSVTIDFKSKKNRDLFARALKKAGKGRGKSIGAVALAKAYLGGA